MTIRKSNTAVIAEAGAFATALDGGYFELREGTQPATADTAATGTLVVTIPLNTPAFISNVNGVVTLDVPIEAVSAGGGNAGWGRFFKADASPILDVSVSAGGGGGDLIIDNATILPSDTVKIVSFTYSIPKQ